MASSAAREHRTVTRVITILESAAAAPNGVSLGQLASLLKAPKSSVHGLVRGLVAMGYLEEGIGGYTMGPAIFTLSTPGKPFPGVSAHRSLQIIQGAVDESATLCVRVGDNVVYIDRVESTQMIRYSAPLRVRRPLYPTSAGKCYLAHMTEAEQLGYLRDRLGYGSAQVIQVQTELDEVVRQGYSTNRGETLPDVFAVASPIIIAGDVVACLQVAGPAGRMADRMEELAKIVFSEAQRLSGVRT